MKKLLFVIVVLIIGFALYRTLGVKESAAPAKAEAPAATHPVHREDVVTGATLNKVFPEPGAEFKLTFTQEKDGFAQADLSKGGTKVASLTVSDTHANPSARDKFKASTKKIGGFPAAANGSMGTAVLAGERYQVQVRSLAPSFTEAEREAWLGKFKLAKLAEVK